MSSVTIYLLFTVTPDEEQQIKNYLSQTDDSISIEVVYWTGTSDGSTNDIYTLWNEYPAEEVMIIIDRDCMESENFIIANGNAVNSASYVQATLEQYGYTYSETWYQDETLVSVVSQAGVPIGTCDASQGVVTVYESITTESVDWETYVTVTVSVNEEFDSSDLEAAVTQCQEQYGTGSDDDGEFEEEDAEVEEEASDGEGDEVEVDAEEADEEIEVSDGEGGEEEVDVEEVEAEGEEVVSDGEGNDQIVDVSEEEVDAEETVSDGEGNEEEVEVEEDEESAEVTSQQGEDDD